LLLSLAKICSFEHFFNNKIKFAKAIMFY